MSKHAGGRPRKLTPDQTKEVVEAFEKYIVANADPTISWFVVSDPVALKYDINKDNINQWEEFNELRKRSITKQESYLLAGATQGRLSAPVSIFRLKQPQHGYSDKQEIDQHIDGELKTGIIDPKLAKDFEAYITEQTKKA